MKRNVTLQLGRVEGRGPYMARIVQLNFSLGLACGFAKAHTAKCCLGYSPLKGKNKTDFWEKE